MDCKGRSVTATFSLYYRLTSLREEIEIQTVIFGLRDSSSPDVQCSKRDSHKPLLASIHNLIYYVYQYA